MDLIEFAFRNESVFMHRNDITGLWDEDWFLKILCNNDLFKKNINIDSKGNNIDKIEINEDKNTAMSLIESLRYNRLIVLPNVSLDYMLSLSEKWCMPDFINNYIKGRIQNDTCFKEIISDSQKFTLNMTYQCNICKKGFKILENNNDSCYTHPKNFNLSSNRFECCGKDANSKPCTRGYHVLTTYDRNTYFKNFETDNDIQD